MSQRTVSEQLMWQHQPENNGATPFYISCEQGHVDVARFMSLKGADVEAANANNSSPLFIACLKGHLPVVKLLANELQVDCERSNANGATPFYVSCEKGHLDVVRFLGGEKGVNVGVSNINGVSPLWIACQDGHDDVLTLPHYPTTIHQLMHPPVSTSARHFRTDGHFPYTPCSS
jgi:ankyrin repeat protein